MNDLVVRGRAYVRLIESAEVLLASDLDDIETYSEAKFKPLQH